MIDESVYELSKISKPSFTFVTQSIDLVHSMLEQFVCDLCINDKESDDDEDYYNQTIGQQIDHMLGSPCGCEFILQRYESYDDYYVQTRVD